MDSGYALLRSLSEVKHAGVLPKHPERCYDLTNCPHRWERVWNYSRMVARTGKYLPVYRQAGKTVECGHLS